jgi:hypothetical protein
MVASALATELSHAVLPDNARCTSLPPGGYRPIVAEPMTSGELERLLAVAARDPAEQPAFIQALLGSDVYVLGDLDPPPVDGAMDGVAQVGSSVQLVGMTGEQLAGLTGEQFAGVVGDQGRITPFFSSESMVRATVAAWPGTNPNLLRLGCRALFELTTGSRLVLNPHGPYAKIFVPAEIDALLRGDEPYMTTELIQTERQLVVGAAARVPPALLGVLSRFLAQRPVVQAARFGWVKHPDGHQGYFMVVVASDREAAMAGFGSVQISELTHGDTLDVIVVPPNEENRMLSNVAPFYVRSSPSDAPQASRRRLFRRS